MGNMGLIVVYVIGAVILSYGFSGGNEHAFAGMFGFLVIAPVLFITMLRYLDRK